ncbi:MAG TPA: hypothetical protein VHZ81_09790 [Galbitalea sp.]|nr:hypothetical protein [Galbitalea sp.]
MTYDESGRHLSTTTTGGGGATVSYRRDASNEVVQMTSNSTTVQYGGGGGVQFTFSTSGGWQNCDAERGTRNGSLSARRGNGVDPAIVAGVVVSGPAWGMTR